jgi:hypothetical protein
MRPANLTPGMWREEQLIPSKSQIALALWFWFWLVFLGSVAGTSVGVNVRLGVDLVEESACDPCQLRSRLLQDVCSSHLHSSSRRYQ